jgi:hypothetical protein
MIISKCCTERRVRRERGEGGILGLPLVALMAAARNFSKSEFRAALRGILASLIGYTVCPVTSMLCYGHILTKAAPLIRTGNLNVSELHQYWVE